MSAPEPAELLTREQRIGLFAVLTPDELGTIATRLSGHHPGVFDSLLSAEQLDRACTQAETSPLVIAPTGPTAAELLDTADTIITALETGTDPAQALALDLLRKAAAKIREMAEGTTGAPWVTVDCDVYPRWILGTPPEPDYAPDVAKVYSDDEDALQVGDADWRWMAFASPVLAEPLAAWLEQHADPGETHDAADLDHALAVARAILGGDQ